MSSFGRVVDTVAPPRLGTGFRWLLSSSWVSALGDGLSLAAGPLLVASQTHQPFLVALAALLQRLPWLLFGLYAGALADRIDRRRMVILWDGLRVVVLAFLAVTVATGWVDITVVLVVMFLVGLAEVFAGSASRTLLPMLVHRDDLGIGNARLMTGAIALNQLSGPPIGAFLFAAGMALPFVTQAVCVALGVVLIARVATPKGAVRDVGDTHIRRDIADGVRWLVGHRRCGRWRSRSSPSTSPGPPRGRCSSSTPTRCSAWARSGSACSPPRLPSAGSSRPAATAGSSATSLSPG